MGEALASLGRPRNRYVVSTKFYWGLAQGEGEFPNERKTPNREYLLGARGAIAQLPLAWYPAHPNVGTVITGATRAAQIDGNTKALEFAPTLDAEAMRRIDAIVGTAYD